MKGNGGWRRGRKERIFIARAMEEHAEWKVGAPVSWLVSSSPGVEAQSTCKELRLSYSTRPKMPVGRGQMSLPMARRRYRLLALFPAAPPVTDGPDSPRARADRHATCSREGCTALATHMFLPSTRLMAGTSDHSLFLPRLFRKLPRKNRKKEKKRAYCGLAEFHFLVTGRCHYSFASKKERVTRQSTSE